MGTAPFLPNYIARYDADTIRYYLAAIMPETSDAEFNEEDLVRRNNEELVATWGNLVNRVLSPLARNFDGRVPDPGTLKPADEGLIARGDDMLKAAGEHIAACHFRDGLRAAMAYASDANRYLSEEAPWKAISEGRIADAARAYYTALCAVEAVKLALYPYLPFSAQALHAMLGHGGAVAANGWKAERPRPGGSLGTPKPLFRKLDLVAAEGGPA
jgi:methionyl-tRNA synthetase